MVHKNWFQVPVRKSRLKRISMPLVNIEYLNTICLLRSHSQTHSFSLSYSPTHPLSHTLPPSLSSLSQVVPLANLIVKEALSEEDVLTCQKTVYNLVDMERKNDPLPISTVGSRGKGPKR